MICVPHRLPDDAPPLSLSCQVDGVCIPLALLVLAWRVRSPPLLVIPPLALGVSMLVAFAVLDAISTVLSFPSFCPALFVCTSVSICFDWNLFLLGRYSEGVKAGRCNEQCVYDAMRYAGHTVVLSGVTLIVAYASLLFFPLDFIHAIGSGAMVVMGSCLLVNMSLTPAILLTFPSLLRRQWSLPCVRTYVRSRCGRGGGGGGGGGPAATEVTGNYGSGNGREMGVEDSPSSEGRRGSGGTPSTEETAKQDGRSELAAARASWSYKVRRRAVGPLRCVVPLPQC